MDLSPEKICKNFSNLKSSRQDFDSYFQTLHDYFYVEGSNITAKKNKGSEINVLLDATSLNAGDVLASGLANYLTPEASKWVFLQHSNPALRDNREVKEWCQDVTDEVLLTLSRSNFYNQMPIFYKASGVYGTAGLFCEKGLFYGINRIGSIRFLPLFLSLVVLKGSPILLSGNLYCRTNSKLLLRLAFLILIFTGQLCH